MTSVETVDDILFDTAGSHRAAAVLSRLDALVPRVKPVAPDPAVFRDQLRLRLGSGSKSMAPPTEEEQAEDARRKAEEEAEKQRLAEEERRRGSGVMRRCYGANAGRYRTLLTVEPVFPPEGDYGMLMVPACQILETELLSRFLAPLRDVGANLVAALRDAGDKKQAVLLEQWSSGQLPGTIGLCCVALLACYRATEKGDADVLDLFRAEFSDAYLEGFRGNRLGRALDRLRTEFRNPACHGTVTFGRTHYAGFVNLLVAAPTFNEFHNTLASQDGQLVFHLLHHTGGYRLKFAKRELWARTGKCPVCNYPYKWDGQWCMNCYYVQR